MTNTRRFITNTIITIAIASITFSLWAYFNRPQQEPAWPKHKITGFCFQPMRSNHDPIRGILPSPAEIEEDLLLLKKSAHSIRTYSVDGSLRHVPALAKKHGFNIALGAWVGPDMERNESEIETVIKIAQTNHNVVRVFIGNEVVLRNDIPIGKLYEYLDRARNALDVPVSTAEPWHVWVRHTELADHVDFLGVHMLPYWEGVANDDAVDYLVDSVNALKKAFPKKPIVLGEVGWPSNGRTRRSAHASEAAEATFLRRFIEKAQKEKYTFYIMEAFDQPWKAESEGSVGAYWGVYDVNRKPKFAFTEPIVKIPHWTMLAAISVVVALITVALLFIDSQALGYRGRSFLAVIAYAASTLAVWVVFDYTNQYLTVSSVTVGILLILGMVGVIAVILAEAHEWAETLWVIQRRRSIQPVHAADADLPMISIHVPAYNEPPEMLKSTLDALATLNYPKFEVLVIDNNTQDEAVWQPVAEHCDRLGPRFRFFHVSPLAGFKAGALNYALRHTNPDAAIIVVIDSDYQVTPEWLRELAPHFQNPKVALVQAPQDYRDNGKNAFKSMCYNEYGGFFFIGMIVRNERNAIIQHGTMTMVRRSVLEEVGGWAEWCITEDAELGLRIFRHGYEAVYIPKTYGRGLMPDNFIDYKKQRFRWAYGAVQIVRRHAGALSGLKASSLTAGQRYHFWAGWLPWMADGVNLLFNLAAVGWSAAMIAFPMKIDPPLVTFSILPLAFLTFKAAKLFNLYHTQAGANFQQTLAAGIAGLSLSHTIARAMLLGLVTKNQPFFRTPKMADDQAFFKAVAAAREETLIMIVLWLAAAGVVLRHGSDTMDIMLWIIVLIAQSLPYACSFIVSLISAMPNLKIKSFVVESMIRARI